MTAGQIHKIFKRKRNYGASAQIARELGVCRSTILQWFRGRVDSARISAAIQKRAIELLDEEKRRRTPTVGGNPADTSNLPI